MDENYVKSSVAVYGDYDFSLENVLSSLENKLNSIEHYLPKNDDCKNKSIHNIIQEKNKMFQSAVDLLQELPYFNDLHNKEYINWVMKDTLLKEMKEFEILSKLKEPLYNEVDEILKLNPYDEADDTDELSTITELKKTQIEAKQDLEYVLDTLYPEIKGSIKEILSTIEQESKSKTGETCVQFNEVHLLPVLRVLERTGIVEAVPSQVAPTKHKLSIVDFI